MKRLLALLLAAGLAGSAQAEALFIRCAPTGSTQATGLDRIGEAAEGTSHTLGGDFRVVDICSAPEGATDALRRGTWFWNGSVNSDSTVFDLIVIEGDDKGGYSGSKGSTASTASSGGFGTLFAGGGNSFQWLRPGMVVTGNGINGSAVIVGIDSSFYKMTVKGTTTYNASFTLSWRTPVRPDSLTRSFMYPKVPILRLGQFMGIMGGWTTSTTCSTGVVATAAYAVHEDSTRNVYEVGNPHRSWKARQWYKTSSPKDVRGFRAILASATTRLNPLGDPNNYDYSDPACIDCSMSGESSSADTVVLWMVMNNDATPGSRVPLGGDAKPNIYACISQVNGTNLIDPGTLLTALSLADSLSGGGLFGESKKLPRQMAFHIDDGWKRGDSRFNRDGAYGGIGVTDTTAFKASIDSLAALQIPFVVGVEVDSLDSVLLADARIDSVITSGQTLTTSDDLNFKGVGVGDVLSITGAEDAPRVVSIDSPTQLTFSGTLSKPAPATDADTLHVRKLGNGKHYDQRWWARAPLAKYTPHSHAGLTAGTNRTQNTGTIGASYTGKYLRVLDIWGLSRTRYAFGSVDSALAYSVVDHQNDIADTAATYWLNKRAFALLDSTFGKSRVDRLVMPPGDDWTNFQVKHTRRRQHGLGVDSIMAAAVTSGARGIRMNAGINVFGNDDSTTTNNYGWWTTPRTKHIGLAAGAAGSPSWFPARVYGRPCHMVTTDGYPANSSQDSWSLSRTSYGGEKFLNGLLYEHVNVGSDPTTAGRAVFVLASHASDFGSSGDSGYQTRPMFYTFKYVTNAIRAANARAYNGRKLVDIVYPDEIRP